MESTDDCVRIKQVKFHNYITQGLRDSVVATPFAMTSSTVTPIAFLPLVVTWEALPDDYILDDSPVDSLSQPLLAMVLREILAIAKFIRPEILVATNFGICATVNGYLEIKAPDWVYVARVNTPGLDRRSCTPELEGDAPTLVMEFISYTDDYSSKPTHPVGKWFFYELHLRAAR